MPVCDCVRITKTLLKGYFVQSDQVNTCVRCKTELLKSESLASLALFCGQRYVESSDLAGLINIYLNRNLY